MDSDKGSNTEEDSPVARLFIILEFVADDVIVDGSRRLSKTISSSIFEFISRALVVS